MTRFRETAKRQETALNDLAALLQSARCQGEMQALLTDLCTPTEVRAMAERWHVAQLLETTDLSYRDITAQTGVSTTTVGRVARFLRDEPNGGYRAILKRMKT